MTKDDVLFDSKPIYAIVPAAGIGSRMQHTSAKQYLPLQGQAILSHTLSRLIAHSSIAQVIVALHSDDTHFDNLPESKHPKITKVTGGESRAESVLAALATIQEQSVWAMVHDAARPCLTFEDIDKMCACLSSDVKGVVLGMPVKDTMKRVSLGGAIEKTVDREGLWHALTPQIFPNQALHHAIEEALKKHHPITDESSAMEYQGIHPTMLQGRFDNIKITYPNDLAIADMFLMEQEKEE